MAITTLFFSGLKQPLRPPPLKKKKIFFLKKKKKKKHIYIYMKKKKKTIGPERRTTKMFGHIVRASAAFAGVSCIPRRSTLLLFMHEVPRLQRSSAVGNAVGF